MATTDQTLTVRDLLEHLDGKGLVLTDDELIIPALMSLVGRTIVIGTEGYEENIEEMLSRNATHTEQAPDEVHCTNCLVLLPVEIMFQDPVKGYLCPICQ